MVLGDPLNVWGQPLNGLVLLLIDSMKQAADSINPAEFVCLLF